MEGSTKYDLVVNGQPLDKDKEKLSSRNSKSKGRSNPLFIRLEDARNSVKFGIIKGNTS
jgi:hypothetical protein